MSSTIFKGIPVSEGLVVSEIARYDVSTALLDNIKDCEASENEEQRLLNALDVFKNYVERLMGIVSKDEKDLLQAYILMAESLISEAVELVNTDRVCGELAIKRVFEKYSSMLRSSESQLIAMREADLREIALSLISNMVSKSSRAVTEFKDKVIVAEELTPMTLMWLARIGVKGLVTVKGGYTSHVAVLARSRGLPYVVIPSLSLAKIPESARCVLDGFEGVLIVNPTLDVLSRYSRKSNLMERFMDVLKKNALRRARSLDGIDVEVLCNIGDLEEARSALSQGCDGIGVFRVEFLYIQGSLPSEETLSNIFSRIAQIYGEKPVVIRAPDLGADKPLPFLGIREDNPALGLRGIRLLLEYKEELLKPFLRAFLRALSNHDNLRLLIPMVTRPSEVYDFVETIEEIAREVTGIDVLKRLVLGIMIETPAAALIIDKLADTPFVKFASFGTNDLVQYTLAVDRNNPRMAYLYNELEPSVLRLMKQAVDLAVEKSLVVEVCGEMASKPMAIPILLSLGFRTLSVNPRYVGVVKYIVNNLALSNVLKNRAEILAAGDPEEVVEIAKRIYREHGLTDILELYG